MTLYCNSTLYAAFCTTVTCHYGSALEHIINVNLSVCNLVPWSSLFVTSVWDSVCFVLHWRWVMRSFACASKASRWMESARAMCYPVPRFRAWLPQVFTTSINSGVNASFLLNFLIKHLFSNRLYTFKVIWDCATCGSSNSCLITLITVNIKGIFKMEVGNKTKTNYVKVSRLEIHETVSINLSQWPFQKSKTFFFFC